MAYSHGWNASTPDGWKEPPMSDEQARAVHTPEHDADFFHGGWCWMSHPDYNYGNAIPVFMYEVDGERFYVPLDPSEGGELVWDERDAEWEITRGPMAELEEFIVKEQLVEALRDVLRIAEAASIGVTGNAKRLERARAAITRATEGEPK
jgi:hypothetical protein